MGESASRRDGWRRLGWWALAVGVPFGWLVWQRLATLAPGRENSVDCFYHVRMADLGLRVCFSRTFPWTQLSIWRDHFHDKELLFHVVLSGMRAIGDWLALPAGPPFHWLTLLFSLAVVATFAAVARGLRLPWIPALCIVLAAGSPFFTLRITMLRPHNLAIVLMLMAVWGCHRTTSRRRLWIPFALGWLFVYGYSNPHFVLLPVLAFAVVRWRDDRRLALAMPGLAVGGLVTGLLIHPQFPNGFAIWRVQCLQVVHQILFEAAPVHIGDEMLRPNLHWILENGLVLFTMPVASAWLAVMLHRRLRQSASRWRPETLALLLMQAITAVGCFLSQRTIEYACPFGLLAIGLLLRDLRDLGWGDGCSTDRRRALYVGVAAALAVLLALMPLYGIRRHRPGFAAPFDEFGAWAATALPTGLYLANVDWSDFPMLFYSAPHLRYSLGLDPMFGYYQDPERIARLERFRTGALQLTPTQVKALVGSRYIFMSAALTHLSRDLYEQGYVILWQGEVDGWVYDLDASAANRERQGLPP